MEYMQLNFRKKLLVYPELQRGLIVYMMWLGLIVIIINIIGSIFCLSDTIQILHTTDLTSDTEISNALLKIWLKASIITFFSVIGVVATFSYFSLRFTNRIAGPALQMKNKLANYIEKEKFEPIQLRDKDYFKDLADLINQAISKKSRSKE